MIHNNNMKYISMIVCYLNKHMTSVYKIGVSDVNGIFL